MMPKARECRCCRNINVVDGVIEEAGIKCITDHEGFSVNCLNHHVLRVSFYEYLHYNGPLGDEEPIHESVHVYLSE